MNKCRNKLQNSELEVATPTPRPFSGRGCHALSWRSPGHSLAAYLVTLSPTDSGLTRCDCLKAGLDFISTDFQAVARHFGRLERMA